MFGRIGPKCLSVEKFECSPLEVHNGRSEGIKEHYNSAGGRRNAPRPNLAAIESVPDGFRRGPVVATPAATNFRAEEGKSQSSTPPDVKDWVSCCSGTVALELVIRARFFCLVIVRVFYQANKVVTLPAASVSIQ
jgi:hypothetical protein